MKDKGLIKYRIKYLNNRSGLVSFFCCSACDMKEAIDILSKEFSDIRILRVEEVFDPKYHRAINLLDIEYEKAKKNPVVRNTLAYALYQVWKKADQEDK